MLLTNDLEASTRIANDFMEWLSDVECTECLLTTSLANALVGLSDIKVGLLRDCAKARVSEVLNIIHVAYSGIESLPQPLQLSCTLKYFLSKGI